MKLSDFHYHLPAELIAQEPPAARDGARMLVIHRGIGNEPGRFEDRQFRELASFIRPGDCLVLNDSRVLPSRLFGPRAHVDSQVNAEVMLLEPVADRDWRALVRPGRKLRIGDVIRFDASLSAEFIAHGERGERTVRFLGDEDVYASLDRLGHMPLPPYIRRQDRTNSV